MGGVPPKNASALLEAAEVSTSTLYRILGFYAYHRALDYAGTPLRADKKKIIALAGGLRADRAVPDTVIKQGPSLPETHRRLDADGIRHVFGFASAANLLSYFEPAGITSIYLAPGSKKKAKRILERKGRETIHVHVEDMARIKAETTAEEYPITSPVRTLIDLTTDPNGGAHAAFLEEVLRRRGVL